MINTVSLLLVQAHFEPIQAIGNAIFKTLIIRFFYDQNRGFPKKLLVLICLKKIEPSATGTSSL